ncbi:hypothetical protein ABB55_04885 [Prosthecomicrobium hirschii]|uniref:Phasin domain-containing protein n=1 Tax=Prosthecodimorpha hirschii TaxID=665126 RepID=A0A0P6VN28_9HYPH|nr:hypothetical protein ABB55_04885 [Prosthecomicrobium hirschii]
MATEMREDVHVSKTNNPFEGWPTPDWSKDVNAWWSRLMATSGPTANTEMLDRVRTISKESVAFLEERVKKDMEIARAITQAKSPADLAQLQMEYIQGLMTDYNRQAMKMAEEAGKNMTSLFGKWPGTGR